MGACLPLSPANSSNAIIRITSFDNRIIAAGINTLYRTNAALNNWENSLAVSPYYAVPIAFQGDLYYSALNEATQLWRVDSSFSTSTLVCASIGSSFTINLVASSTHLYGLTSNHQILRLKSTKDGWDIIHTFPGDDIPTRASAICVHEERLYIGMYDGTLYRLNLAENGVEVYMTPSWSGYTSHLVSYAGNIYGVIWSTTQLFRAAGDWISVADCGQQINDFAACYGTLYVGCDQGFIFRLNSGETEFIVSSQMSSSVWSMTTMNNILYPGSYQDGILYEYNTIDPTYYPTPTTVVIATGITGDVFFALQNVSDSPLTNVLWDFGDGNTSTDVEATHTYTTANLFTSTGTFQNIYNTATFTAGVEVLQGGRIFYDGNGNTGGTAPVDLNAWYNTSFYVADKGDLVRTNYRFTGWNTESDGSGTTYVPPNDYITIYSSDVTLYAMWTPGLTITYHGNGNTGGTAPIDSNVYLAGEWGTVLGQGDLVKGTDVFYAWNTMADGTGTTYRESDGIYITANVQLYAQWVGMGPSYWDTELSGITTSQYGIGRSTADMSIKGSSSVYEGWDLENTWFMNEHE